MLPCVCSVIDHRWRQNVVKTKKWHTSRKRVCHWCFYHILKSSVIYYWTDPRQHGIYLFYTMIRKEKRPIHIPASYRLTVWRSVLAKAFFPNTIFRLCFFISLSYLSTGSSKSFQRLFCSKQNNGENIFAKQRVSRNDTRWQLLLGRFFVV